MDGATDTRFNMKHGYAVLRHVQDRISDMIAKTKSFLSRFDHDCAHKLTTDACGDARCLLIQMQVNMIYATGDHVVSSFSGATDVFALNTNGGAFTAGRAMLHVDHEMDPAVYVSVMWSHDTAMPIAAVTMAITR